MSGHRRMLRSAAGALAAGGMLVAVASAHAEVSSEPFEIVPGSLQITPSTTQAAAHEDLTTEFDFAHDEPSGKTHNDVRTITVNLPAGFDASNTAVPTCSTAQLIGFAGTQGDLPACPADSQVGQIGFEIANPKARGAPPVDMTVPLYNMEVTSFGVAAELGFKTQVFTQTLKVFVRPGDLGLTVTTPNIQKVEVHKVKVTVWGAPAAHEHDAQRGETCGAELEVPAVCKKEYGGPVAAGIPAKPFLSNPTSCGTFAATMEAFSWEEPLAPVMAATEVGPIGECERVPFEPTIGAKLNTNVAETPTGLDVTIALPQTWENPFSISTADLKDAVVSLPVGMTVNPSAGSGLAACSEAQYAAETASTAPGGSGCPQESKLGNVTIETPLLDEDVKGSIYLAQPAPRGEAGRNPFNTLLALYIVAKLPERGILVKVAGEVHLDRVTGQLVATFLNNPQQPFSKFTLEFATPPRGPLVTPAACSSYALQAQFTPWSAPGVPQLLSSQPFAIDQGVHEGACPTGGVPPFKPQAITGTQNNAGGTYSPFYLRLIREDGEQEITKFTTVLPPGVSANLDGIPFCPDSAIEAARNATGQQEISAPSCPAASEIGHTLVGAGVGSELAWTPGKVYLAGSYHGSALSIVSITSATVGPFDLGTVVIRFALRINPVTGQAEIDSTGSDPIPHIIDGVVVHVRDIHAYIDRPNFMVNPTSCERMTLTNTVTGAGADPSNPADQTAVTVTTPFQAADCSSLAFKPKFTAVTAGKVSRKVGASLHVDLTYPAKPLGTQANIRAVKVDLPRLLPSNLKTLQQACPDKVFNVNPANCPHASLIGTASTTTPIVPVPLTGPVYFVSHAAVKFPDLVIVLQGYGITIDLRGETFISKKGITSTTFRTVPDEPVGKFELTLPQGPFSALSAPRPLCAHKLLMPTSMVAQNGMAFRQTTQIKITGCPKVHAHKKHKKHRRKRHKR